MTFWTVTSSALVGSSATMIFGLPASAIAMSARCFMPPLSSCGYWWNTRSASLRPAVRRLSSAACLWCAASRASGSLNRTASITCRPIFLTGFSDVLGSWGMKPT